MKKEKIRMNNVNIGLGVFGDLKENKYNVNSVGFSCYTTQRGITLIALIITIIILLILAGVTISLTIGDNGLFKTAKEAGIEYEKAKVKEELEIAIANMQTKKIAEGKETTREDLKELINSGVIIETVDIPTKGEYKDYVFEINENYEVTILEKREGEIPKIEANVITEGKVKKGLKVEIKVRASIKEGTIASIEATNGAELKQDANNTDTEKTFEVVENGTYYFKVTASNKRINMAKVEVDIVQEGKLTISIDNVTSKSCKINITDTKSIENDNMTFEYYCDDIKVATTQEKYYEIDNIDWTQEHTIYVKEFSENNYKDTSKKYHLKNGENPQLTSSDNPSIITEGNWFDNYNSSWSSTGKIYNYYAFDKNFSTYAGPAGSGSTPIGCSIGYDFGRPVMVYEASGVIRMYGYKIQASNDNKTWEDIVIASSPCSSGGNSFENEITDGKEYRYWRLYINGGQSNSIWGAIIWELQFNYIELNIED